MHSRKPGFGFLNRAGVILLGSLLLAGCNALKEEASSAKTLSLPPITTQPTHRQHPGKFVWHDLLTADTLAARSFYGELFGWSFREEGNYIEIYNGARKIGGILAIQPGGEKKVASQWLAAMSVSDADAAAEAVRTSGGKVLNGPMELGQRGRALLISDPGGAHLLLLHARDGDPRDREPAMGDWLWNEVWTLEPEPLIDFYKPLGQYQEVIRGEDYAIFVGEGRWRAGVRTIRQEAFAGRWVPVVRVEDPAALLDKVRELGGTVWLAPGEEGASEDTALIADRGGAMLILQRWTFPADREGG